MRTGDDGVAVLRSKYHDWCSARVADRFAELSPEEIYQLAHGSGGEAEPTRERARGAEASASRDADVFALDATGYSELVRRVTEALATSIDLPSFEEWVESYRQEPERYDREMIGFWRGQ